MLSDEEIEKANTMELATRIYRVQEFIIETVIESGEISQFKEDVMYIINNLLERQLNKEELNACEKVAKNQNARLQIEKEKYLQREIEQLETNNQKLIEKLEEDKRKYNEFEFMPLQIEKAYNNYYKIGRMDEADEILKILKGEKE